MPPQPPFRLTPILILTERIFIDDTPIEAFEHGRTDERFEEEPTAEVDPSDLLWAVGEAEVDALARGEEGGGGVGSGESRGGGGRGGQEGEEREERGRGESKQHRCVDACLDGGYWGVSSGV
jgi:hypothetical protein